MNGLYDVTIIGGGINGCGIAAEASQRGLSVLLLEQEDLASKTSSSSSNLIHGGLRYLEQYDFSLVKKALDERQRLLTLAPHLVHPLAFVLPYIKGMRPKWLLRTGLFIYDHLSRKNVLPKSRFIRRSKNPLYFNPLHQQFQNGFLYYDAMTHDARLTIENALQAQQYGARIYTHTAFLTAEFQAPFWLVQFQQAGQIQQCKSRCLINAAGPWVNPVLQQIHRKAPRRIALVKGSHILVKSLYTENHAYMLQHTDNRIIFIAPYHGFTMIGTTDVRLPSIPQSISISEEEKEYLLDICNHYFQKTLGRNDIIHSWSGIRPLIENMQGKAHELTRDYELFFEKEPSPVLTVYGGKVTTYRQLAVNALSKLETLFPHMTPSISATIPLPGAVSLNRTWKEFCEEMMQKYSWLEFSSLRRLLDNYGTRIEQILENCQSIAELGKDFGHGLYQREVDWLIAHEWARSAEDILWRRTKLGLFFTKNDVVNLSMYMGPAVKKDHTTNKPFQPVG